MSAPTSPRTLLRLAAAVLFFAATASVAISVVSTRLAKSVAKPDVVIVPSAGTDGTTYTPGSGRLLLVDSTPSGASVSLGGKSVGTTPWSSDWVCDGGEAVQVVVARAGSQPHTTVAICQSGTTRIAVTLERDFR